MLTEAHTYQNVIYPRFMELFVFAQFKVPPHNNKQPVSFADLC